VVQWSIDAPADAATPAQVPHLPELGAWDGPVHGSFGILATDGDRICCHICARWFHNLALHVTRTHRVSPEAYRAIYGLNVRTGLTGPTLKARKRAGAAHLLKVNGAGHAYIRSLTPEQRSAQTLSQPRRRERYVKPASQPAREMAAQRMGEASRRRWRDPEFRDRMLPKLSAARGGRITTTCAGCGASFMATRSRIRRRKRLWCSEPCRLLAPKQAPSSTMVACAICGRDKRVSPARAASGRRHTCGDACLRELQRRDMLGAHPVRAPAARARAAAAWREQTAERREAIRASRRAGVWRRARPSAADILALPPSAIAALPPLERLLVPLYYGVTIDAGQQSLTQRELAQRFHLGPGEIATRIRWAITRLLSADGNHAPADGDAPNERHPRDLGALPTLRRRRVADVEWIRAIPRERVDALPEADRAIVVLYYGLDGQPPCSRSSIARQRRLTRGRVGAILTRSIERLLGREASAILGDRQDDFRRSPRSGVGAMLACASCGTPVRVSPSGAYRRRNVTCGEACREEDRLWRAQPTVVHCAVCVAPIARSGARVRDGQQHVCGVACLRELRRHLFLARSPISAEMRARQLATRRRRLEDPTLAPRIHTGLRAAARRRSRGLAERLRQVPPVAFAALLKRERALVMLYYGIGDSADIGPLTLRELMDRFPLTRRRIQEILRASVARLLLAQPPGHSGPEPLGDCGYPALVDRQSCFAKFRTGFHNFSDVRRSRRFWRDGPLGAPAPAAQEPGPPFARTPAYPAGAHVALIYTRVSRDEQARSGLSLHVQRAACKRFARARGWTLGPVFEDVMSGMRDRRRDYQALLAEVRQLRGRGMEVSVVVAALDRLGRRLLERVRCREEMARLGVSLQSVREGGEVSDLVANVLGAVAQEESRISAERVASTRQFVVSNGWRPGGGGAPWGYCWRPATPEERASGAPRVALAIDPVTAPYVLRLFRRARDGASLRSLVRWLAASPASAHRGHGLHEATVRARLRAPVYVARPSGDDPDVLRRPVARWPALIDDALWADVQERLARPLAGLASGRYLLTGFLRCGCCDRRQVGARRPGAGQVYEPLRRRDRRTTAATCPCATLRGMLIDSAVLAQVAYVVQTTASAGGEARPAFRQVWRAHGRVPTSAETCQRLAVIEQQIEHARRRLAVGSHLLVQGDLDTTGYELARAAAEAALQQAHRELTAVRTSTPHVLPGFGDLRAAGRRWQGQLRQGRIAGQRTVLGDLVDHVAVVRVGHGQYDVAITWTPLAWRTP